MIKCRPDCDAVAEALERIGRTRAREFAGRVGVLCHSRSTRAISDSVQMLLLSCDRYQALQEALFVQSFGDKRAGLFAVPAGGDLKALQGVLVDLGGSSIGSKPAVKCRGLRTIENGATMPIAFDRKMVSAHSLVESVRREVDVYIAYAPEMVDFTCKTDSHADYQAMRQVASEAVRKAGWALMEYKLDVLDAADRIRIFDAVFVGGGTDWRIDDITELTVKHDRAMQRVDVEEESEDDTVDDAVAAATDEPVNEEILPIIRQAALEGTALRTSPEVKAWVDEKGCHFTSATLKCHHATHDVKGQVVVRFFGHPTMLLVSAALSDGRGGRHEPGEMNEQAIQHFWRLAAGEYKRACPLPSAK